MTENRPKHARQILPKGSVERSSYLGERGESFFIRASGKGDFKVVDLINRSTFALVDAFFTSEDETRLFAERKNLRIAAFDDNAPLPPDSQERSSKGTTQSH